MESTLIINTTESDIHLLIYYNGYPHIYSIKLAVFDFSEFDN